MFKMSLYTKIIGDDERTMLLERYDDLDFTDVPSKMRCGRCKNVAIHHYFSECDHVFCLNCKSVFENGNGPWKCPTCKALNQKIDKQKVEFEIDVTSLKAHCPNRKYGCSFKDSLKEVSEHLKNCKDTSETNLPVEIKDKNITTILDAVSELKCNSNSLKVDIKLVDDKMLQQGNRVKHLEDFITSLKDNDVNAHPLRTVLKGFIEETLKNSLESTNLQIEKLKAENRKSRGEIAKLNNRINLMEIANSTQQKNFKKITEDNIKADTKTFTKELPELRFSIKNIFTSLTSLQNVVTNLNSQVQRQTDVTKSLDPMKEDISKINHQIIALEQNNLSKIKEMQDMLEKEAKNLNEKLEKETENLKEKTETKSLINRQIKDLDETVSNMQITLSKFKTFNTAVQKLNLTEKTLQNLKDELTAQIENQKNDIRSDIIAKWEKTSIYEKNEEKFKLMKDTIDEMQTEFFKLIKKINEVNDLNDIRKAKLSLDVYKMEQKLDNQKIRKRDGEDKLPAYTFKIDQIKEEYKKGYECISAIFNLPQYKFGAEAKFECFPGYIQVQLRFKDTKNSGMSKDLKLPLLVTYILKDRIGDENGNKKDYFGQGSLTPKETATYDSFDYKGLICYSTRSSTRLPPNVCGNSIYIEIHLGSFKQKSQQIASNYGVVYGSISSYNETYSDFSSNPYMYTSKNGYLVQVQMRPHFYDKFLDWNRAGLAVQITFLASESVKSKKGPFCHKTTVTVFHPKSSARNLVSSLQLREIPVSNEYSINIENESEMRKLVYNDTFYYKVEIKAI